MEQEKGARDAYRVLGIRPDAHQAVVKAAYHALAALYHPDVNPSAEAVRRMAALNLAYAEIRTPDRRAVYDKVGTVKPVSKAWEMGGAAPPPARRADNAGSGVIDFGRYDGWTVADLARHDPDYLRWLSRHTSGVRFRREIEERLGAAAAAAAPPAAPSRRRRMWSRSGA